MTGEVTYLDKAERYLRSVRLLIADGDLDSATSRLYYAMFYIAEDLLDALGQSYSSHRAVIAAYGREFAKTGELAPRYHTLLRQAFERRQLGDYTLTSGLTEHDIAPMLAEAQSFLADARAWRAAHPPQP